MGGLFALEQIASSRYRAAELRQIIAKRVGDGDGDGDGVGVGGFLPSGT